MPRSSSLSNQTAFDFANDGATDGSSQYNGAASTFNREGNRSRVVPLSDPKRSGIDIPYADASRLAGRINAASATEREREELLAARQVLLAKKFTHTLSRHEMHQLRLIEWNLERIEDAAHGWYLDALQGAIENYRGFGQSVHHLVEQLKGTVRTR